MKVSKPFEVLTSTQFLRHSRKFFRKHPELKPAFAKLVEALCSDPFQPSLRLHPLKGSLQGMHAVSLTYNYRVTLTLKVMEEEIILLDIGSHDEVYE